MNYVDLFNNNAQYTSSQQTETMALVSCVLLLTQFFEHPELNRTTHFFLNTSHDLPRRVLLKKIFQVPLIHVKKVIASVLRKLSSITQNLP